MLTQTRPARLRVILERRAEDIHEPDHVSDVPVVQFVAFGRDQRMFGWVRLAADRLTDLLNAHEELLLTDVEIEHFGAGRTRSVDEIVIHRRELVAVRASGPRGDDARRRLTRTHAIAMRSGAYLIGGYLHVPPGDDPIESLAERAPMVPLTDAWIEYWSDDVCTTQSSGTIIVNRKLVDWMRLVTDEELLGGVLGPPSAQD